VGFSGYMNFQVSEKYGGRNKMLPWDDFLFRPLGGLKVWMEGGFIISSVLSILE